MKWAPVCPSHGEISTGPSVSAVPTFEGVVGKWIHPRSSVSAILPASTGSLGLVLSFLNCQNMFAVGIGLCKH